MVDGVGVCTVCAKVCHKVRLRIGSIKLECYCVFVVGRIMTCRMRSVAHSSVTVVLKKMAPARFIVVVVFSL